MAQFDINQFESQYGIDNTPVKVNSQYYAAKQPAQKTGFSVANLGKSIAGIPGDVAHLVTSSFDKIPSFIKGGQQGLPGIGEIAQNQRDFSVQMKAIDAAEKSYTQQYKSGSINKDRFRVLMNDLSTNRSQLSSGLQKKAANYVSPSDFAQGAVQVAGLLPAAGALEKGVAAGSVISKGANGLVKRAALLPVKQAVVTQPVAQMAGETAQGKNIPQNAAITAAALALPGAAKLAGKAAGVAKKALFDTTGLFDHIQLAGGQSVNDAIKAGQEAGTLRQSTLDKLKVAQEQNMANHGDVYRAAKSINESQAAAGRPTTGLNLEQFANEQGKLAAAGRKTQALADAGKLFTSDGRIVPSELSGKVTVGKATQFDKSQIANRLSTAFKDGGVSSTSDVRDSLKKEFPDFFKNKNNSSAIDKILQESKSAGEVKSRINSEITGTNELFTKNASGDLVQVKHPGGYHGIIAQDVVPGFKTPSEVPSIDTGNKALLGGVGSVVRKAGLSPEAGNQAQLQDTLRQNFNNEIDKVSGLEGNGDKIYKALGKQLGQGVLSSRDRALLTKNEITNALNGAGIGSNYAGQVRKALDNATLAIPTEVRGLGGKVTDALVAKVPLERQFLRAQQIGRFSGLNPFFQTKVALKSEALAQAYSGGHLPFGPVSKDVNDYISKSGLGQMFDKQFTDFVGDLPNVNKGTIGKVQQNIAGRMVTQILANHGTTVAELEKNPALAGEINHAIETVFGYPKGGFLDSNFAKAMNVAVFPFRFETKVMTAMGHFLVKQDPITRLALVTGMANTNEWLKSPQGKDWQHQNSELTSIVKYFTPIDTVGSVINALGGKPVKASDFGLLGGLPLGFISTVLQGQGASLGPLGSSDFLDPKTGQIVPKKVPADTATHIKQGLIDFINSTYSYPGKQLGLSSKSSLVTTVVPPLGKGKYNYVGGSATTPKVTKPTVNPGATLRQPTLPANVKVAAIAGTQKKPKKAKTKAVRPGQPF